MAPVSFAQRRLWLLDQLVPGDDSYNLARAFRLTGDLRIDALEQSLCETLRRHEILRTGFPNVGGEPVQLVHNDVRLTPVVVDLSKLDIRLREYAASRLAKEEARRPFILAHAPLLRAGLLQLGERDYVLMVTMHHIVSDGWSVGILMREVAALYEAFSNGRSSPLPLPPLQYADFTAWQQDRLQGEILKAQLGYWDRQLSGLIPLDLPTDRPRPATRSLRGARCWFTIPPATATVCREVSRRYDCTPFITLLAVFQTLLYRYTRQSDIAVGSPIANRNRRELESLIGFLANTVVLRGNLGGDPTFAALLAGTREMALEAYAHQDLPFELVVEHLHLERDQSRPPLFDVMFSLQNTPELRLELPGVSVGPFRIITDTARLDLMMSISPSGEKLLGSVDYLTHLFDPSTIDRFVMNFERLLKSALATPERRLSGLDMLSAAERRQHLSDWNSAPIAVEDRCAHELFDEQALRTPHEVAAIIGEERISFEELQRKANRLSNRLQALGVGSEKIVALCVERSIEALVGLLGIMKAGGAYLPLDPQHPPERMAAMLEDARPLALITQKRLLARLPEGQAKVICLDRDWPEIARESEEAPRSESGAERAVYIIYTSGSTGRPKGVVVSHRSLVNTCLAVIHAVGLVPGDCFFQFAPLTFDPSAFQIFPALISGATLALHRAPSELSSIEIRQICDSFGVTVLDLPAGLWQQWIADLESLDGGLPSSVRVFMTGGESTPTVKVQAWGRMAGNGATFISSYGPTETTAATIFAASKDDLSHIALTHIPLGGPIRNTRVYVLDRDDNLVPIGATGELCVAGEGLARGYLREPALTAERFVPDPFSQRPGARMYRSGDIVRYLMDGTIEFEGRADHQVKIRGFRIELGEIEARLQQHSAVREAVVLVREDKPGQKTLVAYFVSASAPTPSVAELRNFLRQQLADYMVPSAFVLMEELPLTPNSKVDRKALPPPRHGRSRPEAADRPRSPIEETLAGIWSEVLNLDAPGIYENVFELGAHSLTMTQVTSRLRKLFCLELSLKDVFERPTIAALSEHIQELRRSQSGPTALPLARSDRNEPLPLSFSQERLWLMHQLEPRNPNYNNPDAWRLTGRFNIPALEWSLNEIVRRQEALRTSFADEDGRPRQLIAPQLQLTVPVIDLAALPRSVRDMAARLLAGEEAARPFDLRRLPLLRTSVLKLEETAHIVLFTMHHIVSDGWSMWVLTRELTGLYDAYLNGNPPPLPELPLQYADFAIGQRKWFEGEGFGAELAFWKEHIGGAFPDLDLPTDHPRSKDKPVSVGSVPLMIAGHLAAEMRLFAREKDVTLFMLLLATLQALLHTWTSQREIPIGITVANRDRIETEPLIGFFVNELILIARFVDNTSFDELLTQVRASTLAAYAHQHLPLDELVRLLQPARHQHYAPLYRVQFNLNNTPGNTLVFPGISSVRPFESRKRTAKFDLTISLSDDGREVSGWIDYNASLFEAWTMNKLADRFRALLEAGIGEPLKPIGALNLVIESEQQALMNALSGEIICE
jgi:amino acid adenylation domain-containing protein